MSKLKPTEAQELLVEMLIRSGVDSRTISLIMTLLPLEEQQVEMLRLGARWLDTFGVLPPTEKYLIAMDVILKHIPTPGVKRGVNESKPSHDTLIQDEFNFIEGISAVAFEN